MFLGLDISRRDVATVLAQADGTVLMALRTPLPPQSDSLQAWKTALETAQETILRGSVERSRIQGVACALDAAIDANGVVERGALAEGWHGFDLPRALREGLGIQSAHAASRVWCQSLAEERFGALRGSSGNWLYLHVGVHLGAIAQQVNDSSANAASANAASANATSANATSANAASTDESRVNGRNAGATTGATSGSSTRSELAWGEICIERDGALGSSGRRGTLEAYCTHDNFLARAASYGITVQSATEVWAQAGSSFAARSLCDDYVKRLAQGVGIAVSLLQPARIVVGGSLPDALGETLLSPLRATLREFCELPSDFVLCGTQLAQDGAVWGSVALAMQSFAAPPLADKGRDKSSTRTL